MIPRIAAPPAARFQLKPSQTFIALAMSPENVAPQVTEGSVWVNLVESAAALVHADLHAEIAAPQAVLYKASNWLTLSRTLPFSLHASDVDIVEERVKSPPATAAAVET
jgi:hypothetical protein